ncbi:MAG: lipoyl(octanoyl) transferase LipB [Planctomycetota bacterium]|nr:MAG: lipoyl(octanoyl) transferase LipB [Planctomycetota bacterium]
MPPATHTRAEPARLEIVDAGRVTYDEGLALQRDAVAGVQAARDAGGAVGRLFLLEHDPPVITVSRRPDARKHLLASPEALAREGVEVRRTDRGGDITYHGPGQLVAYPILDLNVLGLNLHGYLRFLEEVVIQTCRSFGVAAHRDACATGVWVGGDQTRAEPGCPGPAGGAKICALGVRVQRWVTSHGLALNVTTNLDHFGLIVPCGLAGRPVTSLSRELGGGCPPFPEVKGRLAEAFLAAIEEAPGARGSRR